MLIGRDRKKLTLQNGESMTLAVNSADAKAVAYFAKFTGAGGGGGTPLSIFSGEAAVFALTFPPKAAMTDGDNFIIYDEDGQGWGFYAEVINGSGITPDYAEWNALDGDHIVQVDVSGDTTAQQVATNFRNARGSFSATFSDKFTATAAVSGSWSAIAEYPNNGYRKEIVEAPVVANVDNTGAGSLEVIVDNAGVEGFVDPFSSNLKQIAHGLNQDDPIVFTATDGTLPDGIVQDVEYYASIISVDEFQAFDTPGGGGFVVGPNTYGTGTMTGEGGSGGGSVDATLQRRGSMTPQGQPGAEFHEPTPTAIIADGVELETLSGWPFVQTQIVITNNDASALEVDAGLIARK